MNDDELVTALREQRTKVSMNVTVEQVISRGRAVRARRQIPGVAAALGMAAAALVAASALLPGHPASHRPGIQLAAWTVVKQADGTVYVRVRQLDDPAGLQRKLSADGVPASVVVGDKSYPPGLCHRYGNQEPLFTILEASPPAPLEVGQPSPAPPEVGQPSPAPVQFRENGSMIFFRIDPSALPANAGIQISPSDKGVIGPPAVPVFALIRWTGFHWLVGVSLVVASQTCTGS
jgi:hypothetical protein